MLAEMQQQTAARDLAIQRQARLKAMVEVDREAEKAADQNSSAFAMSKMRRIGMT